MFDHLTLNAAEAAQLIRLNQPKTSLPLVPQEALRASIAMALESVTSSTHNSYNPDKLRERQEILDQKRRESILTALEAETDILVDDPSIENELIAGAHLDELQAVLDDVQEGRLTISQETINDMVGLMNELRTIMPELPKHIVNEIKAVARPLRTIITDFQNRIDVV